MKRIYHILIVFTLLWSVDSFSQQDPQYTQYQYNPMTVNAGYTGSRGHLTLVSLYRNQWQGIEGAPETLTFGVESPVGFADALGLSIIQDRWGPASETYVDANYAHQLMVNRKGHKIGLGLKAGVRFFSLDFSKGIRQEEDDIAFSENINGRVLPSVGLGFFYYTNKGYFGISTPNIFPSEYFDREIQRKSDERIHINLIAGYVFKLNESLKFKPSIFAKQVAGAPISVDISANFLINEKFNLGVNYRWEDSVAGIFGLQITPQWNIGYAYDFTTSNLGDYSSGTHEIFLRYRLISIKGGLKSPRFF